MKDPLATPTDPADLRRSAWISPSNLISITSLIVSSIIAVSLFCISSDLSNQEMKREVKYYTYVWAGEVFDRIDKAVAEKIQIEGKDKIPLQNYEYISNRGNIESLVFTILNQYATLGGAVREGLVDMDVILDLRQTDITHTWNLYKNYILEYRDKKKIQTWEGLEYLNDVVKTRPLQ